MKKALLFLALFNVCSVVFSQETEETTEIKQKTKEERRTRVNELRIGIPIPHIIIRKSKFLVFLKQNALPTMGGLAQRRQYARGKGSGKMNVCSPHKR